MSGYTEQAILELIPHREPFIFIDGIVEMREDGIVTRRKVREDEPYFKGHYPGNPIMPGVLLCEAVFQSAAAYLAHKMKLEGMDMKEVTPVLSRIEEAKFKQMVKPGDEITITAKDKEVLGKFRFMTGTIHCEGKLVVSVGFALTMVEKS